MKTPRGYIINPFIMLVDTREQLPYSFAGLRADARQEGLPLRIDVCPFSLPSGDYSIGGYADQVAVERKSVADLCGTLTRGRTRFVREMARLNELDAAWVVVECELSQLLRGNIGRSQVNPKTLWRSVMALQLRFPRVHWWGCPGRQVAEAVTFRLLEKWWWERFGKCRPGRKKEFNVKQSEISNLSF